MAKPLLKSRTLAVMGSVVTLLLVKMLSKHLPSDTARALAEVLSDEVLSLLAAAAAAAVAWFKQQDYHTAADLARQLADAKAKAEEPKKVADILAIPPKKRRKEVADA